MQSNDSKNPPPYSPYYLPQNPAPSPGFHVDQGNIAVVPPTGNYDNMEHPVDGPSSAPPEYSQGFEDEEISQFSDAAIRRGTMRLTPYSGLWVPRLWCHSL
ncbi:hypothetical protein AAFF_G00402830 [Aldrovandia affinis]|uniref:Uncharacterized protein n=1 Tax=Aldrovandia affinis TaxID=143900 RepID=A0AAD7T785_9TELE|nr:hypothetical protein AAFF_G00402830 [Aldrovandia affinis]